MELLTFLFIACVVRVGLAAENSTIKFLVLRENAQGHFIDWFEKFIRRIETEENVNVDFVAVVLDREETDVAKVCNGFAQGGLFVIDLTWSGSDEAQNVSAELNAVYIRIDLSISPALRFLDAYLDAKNSSDVAVVFDKSTDIDQALYYWIDTTRLKMVISDRLDGTSSKRLKQMRPTPNSFALVANTENLTKLFETALQENLVTLPDRWNLVLLDFNRKSFNTSLIAKKPISLLSLDQQMCCNLQGLKTCLCPDGFDLQENLLFQVMEPVFLAIKNLVGKNFTTIQCNNTKFDNASKNAFWTSFNKEIKDNSSFYEARGTLLAKIHGTVEVGAETGDTEILAKYSDLSWITVEEGKILRPTKSFFRIGTTFALPWAYQEFNPTTGILEWTGYCIDLVKKLSEMMDFDYEIVVPRQGSFGQKDSRGRWDGVIGDLARGETDLAATALVMTADREEVVDFVAPYFEQSGISIVMRKPVRKTSLFKFMTVLKLEVWLSIVGALIVTAFMVWFLDKYSPYSAKNNQKAYPYPCRQQ